MRISQINRILFTLLYGRLLFETFIVFSLVTLLPKDPGYNLQLESIPSW